MGGVAHDEYSLRPIRPPAVAGTWHPGLSGNLTAELDRYLGAVCGTVGVAMDVTALIAPHARLM